MRRYETVVIVDPEISEENRQPVFQKIQDIIDQDNGFLVNLDEWGTKKLAYEIKKKPRGYYACLDYCGTGPTVSELERFFRIDDRVLKFLTIMLDADVDLEKIKAEAAQAEAERKEREAQRAAEEAAAREAAAREAAAAAEAERVEPAESETPATEAETDKTGAETDAETEKVEPEQTPDTAETKEG
jgi:small subunit ribosomal protein S6